MSSPLEMTEMYDNALLGILQHVGNIQEFLQIYFGFLYRKTDFYRLLSGPNDQMGFPPGVAEKMVSKVEYVKERLTLLVTFVVVVFWYVVTNSQKDGTDATEKMGKFRKHLFGIFHSKQTFKLFEKMAEHDRERQQSELRRRQERQSVPPPAVQELEISTEEREEAQPESSSSDPGAAPAEAKVDPQPTSSSSGGASGQVSQGEQGAAASANPAEGTQETFQSNPDSYNGAVRENYSWSQDYTDVEVKVFVPKSIVKGRQVSVSLQSGSLSVSVRDGAELRTLMEGDFTHRINTENSLWSLEPGSCVLLSLSKTSEVWWNAVLKGEKEIDVNQINRERSMASVDDEEHAVLDRLTFDYNQKLQGKPQSHEMKVHEMLKKGWDAEGSPFKGQQFDPSMFDIPPSAVQF